MVVGPDHAWCAGSREDLIKLVFPSDADNADAARCVAACKRFWDETPRHCPWLVDVRAIRDTNASQRKLFADYEKSYAPITRAHVPRAAYIATSAFSQGLLTAVFWLSKPAYPYRVFADEDEAYRWVRG